MVFKLIILSKLSNDKNEGLNQANQKFLMKTVEKLAIVLANILDIFQQHSKHTVVTVH